MGNLTKIISLVLLVVATATNADPRQDFLYDSLSEKMADQLKASLKVKNDPEIIAAQAKYIRSLYEALIKQGFSKQEALSLVSATLSAKD